jgi:hypothetical protein
MTKRAISQPRPEQIGPLVSMDPTAVVIRPAFIRLPKPGRECPFSHLSRTGLVNLCVPNKINGFKPPVRSIVLRQANPKSKRGARLVDYDSLIAYLRGLEKKAA